MISNSGHDENGKYTGGKAGDQTGTEWSLIAWYNRPWNCILRYPDAKVRAKIAEQAIAAAKNNCIGYNQSDRTSFWVELQKVGYLVSKITKNCNADCSSGVIAIIKAVGHLLGVSALQNITCTYTGNMRSGLKAAGFEVKTDSKYLTSDKYLLAGDILLNDQHHVAINVTDGSKAEATQAKNTETKSSAEVELDKAQKYDRSLAGQYKVKANDGLNVRAGAGTSKTKIGVLANGSTVRCYGYWSRDTENTPWLYIVGSGLTGFVSSKYVYKLVGSKN